MAVSAKQLAANRRNAKLGGRPKGYVALMAEKTRAYVAEQLTKNLTPIVTRAVTQAKAGDKHARDWLTEFSFGKPTQPITGANGDPLFRATEKDREAATIALKDMFINPPTTKEKVKA